MGEGKYSFIGSPFSGYDFTTITGNYKYEYKEIANIYADASSVTSMTLGRGYTIANNDVLEFVGVNPITGSATTYIRNSGVENGYNLVCNPYTTAISYDALIAAEGPDGSGDITSTIYIWDDGGAGEKHQSDFITVSTLGSVTGGSGRSGDFNGHIGVAQGFFVECIPSSTPLNFTDDLKVNGNNADANYFRTTAPTYETIKVALKDMNEYKSEILLGWVEDATAGYDYKYDSRKMSGNNLSQLFMPLEGKKLAIQGIPNDYEGSVQLALDIKEAGVYKLDIIESNSDRFIELYDHRLNISHNLSNASYEFSSTERIDLERFELRFNSSSILATNPIANCTIYLKDQWLYIQQDNQLNKTQYRLIDLSGQEIWKGYVQGEFKKNLSNLKSGVYIISNGSQSQKILLK